MTNIENEESLIGKRFGILTVVEINYNMPLDFMKHYYLLCKCDCGNFTSVTYNHLINNKAKSCGCRNLNNILGMKFNMLTVVKRVWNEKFKRSEWLCECECGNSIVTSYNKLNSGHTKSCGCFKLGNFKKIVEKCTKHNMTKTRFHTIWVGIKARVPTQICHIL